MPRSCGSVQNYFRQVDFFPDLRRNQAVLEGMTRVSMRQGRQAQRQAPAEIPVVVHVVHRTDADNISDEQVASQIDVLNEDYAAANDDLKKVPAVFAGLIGNPGPAVRPRHHRPVGRTDERHHPPPDHGRVVRGGRQDEGRGDRRRRRLGRPPATSTSGSAASTAACSATPSSPAARPRPTAW